MSFSKQDQLLQKLQRCVGKLDTKPGYSAQKHCDRERASGYSMYQRNQQQYQKPTRRRDSIEEPSRRQANERTGASINFRLQQGSFYDEAGPSRQLYNRSEARKEAGCWSGANELSALPRRDRTQDIRSKYDYDMPVPVQPRNYQFTPSKPRARSILGELQTNNFNTCPKNLPEERSLFEHRKYAQPEAQEPMRRQSFQPNNYESRRGHSAYRTDAMPENKGNSTYLRQIQNENRPEASPRKQGYEFRQKISQNTSIQYRASEKAVGFMTRKKQNVPELNLKQLSCRSRSKSRSIGIGSISSITRRPVVEEPSSYECFQLKESRQLNVRKILEDVGNANEDTYAKLQQISELNERINSRIKNIIETFENK